MQSKFFVIAVVAAASSVIPGVLQALEALSPIRQTARSWDAISFWALSEASIVVIGCGTLLVWALKAFAWLFRRQTSTAYAPRQMAKQIAKPVNTSTWTPDEKRPENYSCDISPFSTLAPSSTLQVPTNMLQAAIWEAPAAAGLPSAPYSSVALASKRNNKFADGRPICGDSIVLSDDVVLLTGFYKVTWVQEGQLVPGLSRYAILMSKRESQWHVESIPSAHRINFALPHC
jgi:hypothetical protein